jgi:ribosomal protein S15P/S13E
MNVADITMLIIQGAIIGLLVWHGRNFAHQVREARRDEIIRIRIQLGEIYIRYLCELNEILKNNLKEQMSFLLETYDQLSKHLKDRREDKSLVIIRYECNRSGK